MDILQNGLERACILSRAWCIEPPYQFPIHSCGVFKMNMICIEVYLTACIESMHKSEGSIYVDKSINGSVIVKDIWLRVKTYIVNLTLCGTLSCSIRMSLTTAKSILKAKPAYMHVRWSGKHVVRTNTWRNHVKPNSWFWLFDFFLFSESVDQTCLASA